MIPFKEFDLYRNIDKQVDYVDDTEKYKITINCNSSMWHPEITCKIYLINTDRIHARFNISTMRSGCGAVLFSNYFFSNQLEDNKEIINIISNIFDKYVSNGAGTIITTLGQTFYTSNIGNILDKLNFKTVAEYLNYRHGDKYTQRLMIRIYEKPKEV